MLLGEQVIGAQLPGDSLALSVLSLLLAVMSVTTFAGLAQQTSPAESSLLVLCPSGFVPKYQFKPIHRRVQWAAPAGSCRGRFPQAVSVSCSLAHHVLRADGRRPIFCRSWEEFFPPPHWIQWECVKVKKNTIWIFLFTVPSFVSSFVVSHYHRGKPGLPGWCTYSIWRSDRRHGCIEDN